GGGGGGGGGGGAQFPPDRFDPNDTSDAATQFGTLANGATPIRNLSIANLNAVPDYDWFRWSMATAGTFTARVISTAGGTKEMHFFTVNASNTLVELATGALTMSISVQAGEPILVEVKGANTSFGTQQEGFYDLTVTKT